MTAAALYSMQKKAYEAHLDENDGPLTFQEWRLEKSDQIPQFKYWDLVLNLELTVLQFIRSIRTGDFKLYLHSIRALLPWFFSLDHANYSRWLSVHLRDLVNLEKQQPDLYKHFESGKFVARKSNRPFTGIALDQAHEQVNALLKGDGGKNVIYMIEPNKKYSLLYNVYIFFRYDWSDRISGCLTKMAFGRARISSHG